MLDLRQDRERVELTEGADAPSVVSSGDGQSPKNDTQNTVPDTESIERMGEEESKKPTDTAPKKAEPTVREDTEGQGKCGGVRKNKRVRTEYVGDNGQTLYSMAGLYGRTPEEQEELDRKRRNQVQATFKERWAMISAALTVYGPMLLIAILGFGLTALFMYLFLT